ncbi:MAG: ferritin [Acidobacteriota bacterium]|nr:ferritin [Acidobacteriota bacterium]
MFTDKLQQGFNEHINAELYSAYLYLAMASFFDRKSLAGFANWLKIQAQEELAHAVKAYDFVHERGGEVAFGAIAAPEGQWDSPLQVFEAALAHEKEVSRRIEELVALAEVEKDRASRIFLDWFVTEQVEEEASFDALIQQLRLIENAPQALFMLDRELGQRTFQRPA